MQINQPITHIIPERLPELVPKQADLERNEKQHQPLEVERGRSPNGKFRPEFKHPGGKVRRRGKMPLPILVRIVLLSRSPAGHDPHHAH